jgi:hypothetical protein
MKTLERAISMTLDGRSFPHHQAQKSLILKFDSKALPEYEDVR